VQAQATGRALAIDMDVEFGDVEHGAFAEAGWIVEGEIGDAHRRGEQVQVQGADGGVHAGFAPDTVFDEFAEENVPEQEKGNAKQEQAGDDADDPAKGAFHWLEKMENPNCKMQNANCKSARL
jgi:hypothetical protein